MSSRCSVIVVAFAVASCADERTPIPGRLVAERAVTQVDEDGDDLFWGTYPEGSVAGTEYIIRSLRQGPVLTLTEPNLLDWSAERGSLFVSEEGELYEWRSGETTVLDSTPWARDILADATATYWFDERGIVRWTQTAGAEVLVEDTFDRTESRGTSQDEAAIYYTLENRYLYRVAKSDGEQMLMLDLDELWNGHGQPSRIAVDDAAVYVRLYPSGDSFPDGGIVRIEKTSLEASIIVRDSHRPTGLTLDASHVYWTRGLRGAGPPGEIMRARKDGTRPEVLADRQDGPVDVAVVGNEVFWLNTATQELRALKLPAD